MGYNKCLIWGTPSSKIDFGNGIDSVTEDSPRTGGVYAIARSAMYGIEKMSAKDKALLTTWLVNQRRFQQEVPVITSETIKKIETQKSLSVSERADNLLKYMSSTTDHIAQLISVRILGPKEEDNLFDGNNEVAARLAAHSETVNYEDIYYLLNYLESQKYIDRKGGKIQCTITPEGHSYLYKLDTKAIDSKQAFVAMWFDDSMISIYEEGIAKGIEDAGYQPVRIDKKDHNNKIDDEIIAEIHRSRFLVADFTHGEAGMRGGVYYEAGYAHGLNIPVIFTCRQKLLDNQEIHFDTRQYNHIGWENTGDLRKQLANRISATIGDGPLKGGVK